MKIVLLRHGKPDVPFVGWLQPCDMHKWTKSYNESLLDMNSMPSREAVKEAKRCSVVVCSDLPRSIESAKILDVHGVYMSDPNFREVGLPYGNWRLAALPPKVWAALFRVLWFLGYSVNSESFKTARQRAIVCSRSLSAIAKERNSVLFVGHGYINQFIARELLVNGWRGPLNPGWGHWAYGVYRYGE